MSVDEAIAERTALQQADLVRRGEITSAELVDAYLARIEGLNPELRAFTHIVAGLARRRARRVDRLRGRAGSTSLLGVPSAIKDCDPMRCTFTRIGSRAFRWAWTPFDSAAVRQLRAAGLVLTGKTSTSELTLLPIVEPDIHPPTVNPWNPERTAGGSSGGAAAAVAARLVPVAHATDGAGSIRIPSALCHLFGFKHSRELLPNYYEAFEPLGMAHVGAVAFDVEDCCAMLDAYLGNVSHPPAEGSLLAACRREPERGLRVRWCTESPLVTTVPRIHERVREVASLLSSWGHHVEEVPGLRVELEEFLPVFQFLAARTPVLRESLLQPATRWLRDPGKVVGEERARSIKDALAERVTTWFGDADLLLTPTVACETPRANAWKALPPEDGFRAAARLGAFTAAFNVSGQPAASLPVGLGDDGMPIGVQIVARSGADALVLQVARRLQDELGHHRSRAPRFPV